MPSLLKRCRIKYDGHNFFAKPYESTTSLEKIKGQEDFLSFISGEKVSLTPTVKQLEESELFVSTSTIQNGMNYHKRWKEILSNKDIDDLDEDQFAEYMVTFKAGYVEDISRMYDEYITTNSKEKTFAMIRNNLLQSEHSEADEKMLNKVLSIFFERKRTSVWNRRRVFLNKALNNKFNYFVTVTYGDKQMYKRTFDKTLHVDVDVTKEQRDQMELKFEETLKQTLQNLKKRNDISYMGAFERSKAPKCRLHFHALMFVPEGKMPGEFYQEEYFDKTNQRKALGNFSSWFDERFGRTEFRYIEMFGDDFRNQVEYIVKYIGKQHGKIIYSRGLVDERVADLPFDDVAIGPLNKRSTFHILADGIIDEIDWCSNFMNDEKEGDLDA